jgi:hypothetical protein
MATRVGNPESDGAIDVKEDDQARQERDIRPRPIRAIRERLDAGAMRWRTSAGPFKLPQERPSAQVRLVARPAIHRA